MDDDWMHVCMYGCICVYYVYVCTQCAHDCGEHVNLIALFRNAQSPPVIMLALSSGVPFA
jgi:hypothetical protein